jgi:hypothetical protein
MAIFTSSEGNFSAKAKCITGLADGTANPDGEVKIHHCSEIGMIGSSRHQMIVFGNGERLAIEVISDDLSRDLAEVYIVAAGQRISDRCPVHLPTFVEHLEAFAKMHASSPRIQFDFSSLGYEQAFNLLHEIRTTDREVGRLTEDFVFNFHFMHSLDDAVDDWEIYVYDVGDDKQIVFRKYIDQRVNEYTPDGGPVCGVTLPRSEFIDTIDDFVAHYKSSRPQ